MTIAEAIRLLNPETTTEAIAEIEYYHGFSGKEAAIQAIIEASVIACEAMGKQMPKKPDIYGDGYDTDGNLIYDTYDCPNCGKSYEVEYEKHDYCPHCGQALDWGDNNA